MEYICVKKLSLGGREYCPGDRIPDTAFLPGRINKLKSGGYIMEAQETPEPEAQESVDPVFQVTLAPDGQRIPIREDQLQRVLDILRATAAEAATMISALEDSTVLTFVRELDSRKTVKDAAKKAMGSPEAAEDSPEGTADSPKE